jgi:hypothetical protein
VTGALSPHGAIVTFLRIAPFVSARGATATPRHRRAVDSVNPRVVWTARRDASVRVPPSATVEKRGTAATAQAPPKHKFFTNPSAYRGIAGGRVDGLGCANGGRWRCVRNTHASRPSVPENVAGAGRERTSERNRLRDAFSPLPHGASDIHSLTEVRQDVRRPIGLPHIFPVLFPVMAPCSDTGRAAAPQRVPDIP